MDGPFAREKDLTTVNMTKTIILGALAIVAAGGATLATTGEAEARYFGGRHGGFHSGRHFGGPRIGIGIGLGLPLVAASPYVVDAAPVRVCRTRMIVFRGVLQPVRICRIVAAY